MCYLLSLIMQLFLDDSRQLSDETIPVEQNRLGPDRESCGLLSRWAEKEACFRISSLLEGGACTESFESLPFWGDPPPYFFLVRNNSIACFSGLNIESHIASDYYFLSSSCFALATIWLL